MGSDWTVSVGDGGYEVVIPAGSYYRITLDEAQTRINIE